MSYDLKTFCADVRAALEADPGPGGKEQVRVRLEALLDNEAFVAAHLGPDAGNGVHTLHEDPDLGFCVLAHVPAAGRLSPPHDHGTSWAIYGQAIEHTDMVLYRRTDGGAGEGVARLEEVDKYRLTPGKAGTFDVGDIHSIDHAAGARFIRVTGQALERVPRIRYDLDKGEAILMKGQGVGNG